ncbi:MAG: RNA methyltransferase [Flavobacteriales bacterium]|nr:MAG: RNA methyltransferase [Flavobacteriales bacterium]
MKSESKMKIIAKTSYGLEEVLVEELKQLGVTEVELATRAVMFEGTKETLYKANLWLRSANRLIVPIKTFKIKDADDLYDKIKEIAWEDIFTIDQTFAIDSTVFSEIFNHTKFAAFKTKDAIADRFREKFDKRPDVNTDQPHIRINLHISKEDEVTVSLDSSGDPLFKRGYRESRSLAPIKEDLAAGMILLSGWDKKSNFIDFFCGSGTILIEAAMIANNIPPNINRAIFGFMNWKTFDEELFNEVIDHALDQEIRFDFKIIGIDIDARVMGMCRTNIEAAGLTDKIELHKKDFKDFDAPELKGVIVCNPPYGERLGENVDDLYTEFGDNLKTRYDGWNAWLISSNMGALKKVGLRPSRKIKLFNGSLECRFMKYEMYKGTKKVHKMKRADD